MTHGFNLESAALGAVMLAAGVGIPVMAAINAGLGARLDNPVAATVILIAVALVFAGGALFFAAPVPSLAALADVPAGYYLGGFFVAFYALSITWIAPKIGVGNAVFLVLLGQLCAATAIDHFGAFGAPKSPASLARLFGLALMIAGVFLARKPPV